MPFLLKEERLGWLLSVALTFVRLPPVQLFSPLYLCGWPLFLFTPSRFSGWRSIQISVRLILYVDTNRCVLIPSVFFREDVVTTFKNANAKGTFFFSSWSVKRFNFIVWLLSFLFLSGLDGNNCSFIPRIYSVEYWSQTDVGDCIYSEDMVKNVKLAYDNGFQIGSHTWSHPHLTELKPDQGE